MLPENPVTLCVTPSDVINQLAAVVGGSDNQASGWSRWWWGARSAWRRVTIPWSQAEAAALRPVCPASSWAEPAWALRRSTTPSSAP